MELHVERSDPTETYTTADEKVFIRLSASNRELVGSALIKYVRGKCLVKSPPAPSTVPVPAPALH